VACAARQTPAPIEYLPRKAGLSQKQTTLSSGWCDFTSQRTQSWPMTRSAPRAPASDDAA